MSEMMMDGRPHMARHMCTHCGRDGEGEHMCSGVGYTIYRFPKYENTQIAARRRPDCEA